MDAQSILLLIVASINVAFGIFIYHQDRGSPINSSYAAFAWFLALWEVSISFFRFVNDPSFAVVWMRAAYIGATGIGGSFLYFTLHFPKIQQHVYAKRIIVIITTSLLLVAFFYPKFLVKDFIIRDNVKGVIVGLPELILFSTFFIFVFYGALVSLFIHWRRTLGAIKYQIFYIFISVLIAGLVGSVSNLFFVFLDNYRFIWAGPLFPLIIVIATGYAIIKHHLMDIRVIVAEVLTMSMMLIMLLEFFLSKTAAEYLIRGIIVLLVGVFGTSLIKSVVREVKQKEQLEVLTKQLESANKELERLDQAKSEFLSIASHQLRTPLTAIKGYSSMLLDGTFGPVVGKVKEGIDKVYASTERMVALVNDLLDTSRLDSGRMVFTFVETDLGEITKSVCDELMPKGKEKGLVIACTIAPTTPKVFVDQMKIRQVLVNFVDNALKYSDTGVVEVRLECRFSTSSNNKDLTQPSPTRRGIDEQGEGNREGGELVFSVHDNGWGMTPEEMGFLFKKFSRGRGDTSHIKGTGLGLYVARRLAEAHGGRVWAESPGKGQGSTFFLALKVGWKPSSDGVYMPKDE